MFRQIVLELWHISRTALAETDKVATRWERMQYIKKELLANHDALIADLGPKRLWLAIKDELE